MNETEKTAAAPGSTLLEDIYASIAEELRAGEKLSPEKKETPAALPPEEEKEREKKPLFSAVSELFGMDEKLDALKETVTALERELTELREAFAAERLRAEKAEEVMKAENAALRSELVKLRETDELIHMRVFDNRVRIGEVKETLENMKEQSCRDGAEQAVER